MNIIPISNISRIKEIKEDNKEINSFSLDKFKIKKIRCTQAEYRKKIEKRFKQLLIDKKNIFFDENNILHNRLHIKKNFRPTPFQIYEKIKMSNIHKVKGNNLKKLCLSPNVRTSSISINANIFQREKYKQSVNQKENKLKYFKYYSPLRERIAKLSFYKKYKLNNSDNTEDDFSNMIIKNDLTKNENKNKMKYGMKKIIGRNNNFDINFINKYKTNDYFYKKSFLNKDNFSFYNSKNDNIRFRNIPKINNSISQQLIIKI